MLALFQPATKKNRSTTDKETFEQIGSYRGVSPLKRLMFDFQVVRQKLTYPYSLCNFIYIFNHLFFYKFLYINSLIKLLNELRKDKKKNMEIIC